MPKIFQISAQESRRKKKEYMDCLERRMQSLVEELDAYKHRFTNLEGQNISLRSQVQQLQIFLIIFGQSNNHKYSVWMKKVEMAKDFGGTIPPKSYPSHQRGTSVGWYNPTPPPSLKGRSPSQRSWEG